MAQNGNPEIGAGLFAPASYEVAPGACHYPGYLDQPAQDRLVNALRSVVSAAPFFRPTMPKNGRPFSVQMTNCGPLGWVSDRQRGYRYQAVHPETGLPWPMMPDVLVEIWQGLAPAAPLPEAALINYYRSEARMGLHQDSDEADYTVPVVSISLGDTARFRVGGTSRRDRTRSIKLESGDAFVLSGPSRLAFHGIDRIYPGTCDLLKDGGRLNVTLRRVNVEA
ncbi:MAG: alpha-ketoglutarate-dependent dioxygenase AlkB [Pseudomonadota bacterium]